MKYFRITAYNPKYDFSFIMDSNGYFEHLWQFSSFLLQKGFEIIEVSKEEQMIDITTQKEEYDNNHFFLKGVAYGKPEYINKIIGNETYKAIKVGDKIYVPNIGVCI